MTTSMAKHGKHGQESHRERISSPRVEIDENLLLICPTRWAAKQRAEVAASFAYGLSGQTRRWPIIARRTRGLSKKPKLWDPPARSFLIADLT